jgi:dihydroneopterin aldolase
MTGVAGAALVVKIGGSLAEGEGGLPPWLALLSEAGGRAVVVPGGGVFAETVREEQRRLGFSGGAAHRMALLAMEQYALLLADALRLLPCAGEEEVAAALAEGRVPVWLPSRLALGDPALPESWDVTSDSLALRLAQRLDSRRLALVKSVSAPRPLDPAALARDGLVDRAFPRLFAAGPVALDWIGPGDAARLRQLLAGAG